MTSKQRAVLRRLANQLDPVVYVGKEGLTAVIISETELVLEKRELIKVQVQVGCDLSSREVANTMSEKLNADVITVLGKRFVLYRKAKKDSQNLI
ncbi:MAG: YhbY family RNA-binding protein [Eubacteriales bacterium]